eukprot:TCONS_00024927-protein
MYQSMKKLVPPFLNALHYKEKTAIVDIFGKHSYNGLLQQSKILAKKMISVAQKDSGLNPLALHNQTIAFLCSNDHTYVNTQWAIWMTGGTAVPISRYHPPNELQYIIKDCSPSIIVGTEQYSDILSDITKKLDTDLLIFESLLKDTTQIKHQNTGKNLFKEAVINDKNLETTWDNIDWSNTNAHIVYTSGTTGHPKGVVTTFKNLLSQVNDINTSWEVSATDGYLHVLPLHHVHGIVNNLICPLYAGACVTMLDGFDAKKVWSNLLENENVNVFHAVPTIYSKLIDYHQNELKEQSNNIVKTLTSKLRLMVSGSAALPVPVLKKWQEISGHLLLERYGMTEIGMALTNSLNGKRIEGSVGKPFPSVKFRIVSEDGRIVLCEGDSENIIQHQEGVGALEIKGESVFKGYLNLDNVTKESFNDEGWFLTGDTAMYDQEEDVIRILGRTSVDIIKSGGYKLSALEIEKYLLVIPGVKEVAVVGLPDEVYGESVCAIMVPEKDFDIDLTYIRESCQDKMAKYKIPSKLKVVDEIPKNAMGKINKKELKATLFKE